LNPELWTAETRAQEVSAQSSAFSSFTNSVEFAELTGYLSGMRRTLIWWSLICWFAAALSAQAMTGRVIKVLPQFLDLNGRTSLSPSLYDRDAYQALLQQHPAKRSGIRFQVQWKAKGPAWEPLKVRVELRGIARGNLPRERVLEQPVTPGGWFSHWIGFRLSGDEYRDLGEVTAWRVTLWEGQQLLGEQKSFLW
jgi:hypothetical protein